MAEAIPLLERTVAGRERALGPKHPETLTSQNNLAAAYRDAGWVAEAIPLFEQTVADQDQVLGANHLSTLATRHNLANAYLDMGRVAESVTLHEQTLAACEWRMGSSTTPRPWPCGTAWLAPTAPQADPLRRFRCSSGTWLLASGCWAPTIPGP